MEIPKQEDLLDEFGFEIVKEDSDNSWRHGSYETVVYKREFDGTFWQAQYRLSADGEINGLREGAAIVVQVEPFEKTVILYRKIERKKLNSSPQEKDNV